MRNGKLIEEGSPQEILSKYNVNTLETAFLTLCHSREINQVLYLTYKQNLIFLI